MKNKRLLMASLALAVMAVVPTLAKADPVTLTLPPLVNVQAGGSVSVIGTLSNGGAPAFNISSWSINFSNVLLTFDDTGFQGSPLVLNAMQSFGPTTFFDVFANVSLAPGSYLGTFTVFDLERNINVTQTFQINVTQANVPEPISLVLLGSGLGGLLLARVRRKPKAP